MFGLGFLDILIVAISGVAYIAVGVVALFLLLRAGRASEPEAENRRLREQLDRRGDRS